MPGKSGGGPHVKNKLTGAQIKTVMKQAGWPTDEATLTTGVAVVLAESRGDRTAVGGPNSDGSKDYGLWQINDKANADVLKNGDWSNSLDNTKMALVIYKRQGWKAWATYNSGSYKKYLDGAIPMGDAVKEGPAGSAIGSVADAIPNAINAIGQTLLKLGMNIGAILLTLVLLILGVYILMRANGVKASLPSPLKLVKK